MKSQEFASMLNNREYGEEITKEEEKLAKENNLLVVFGASDDLIEFRGAFDDETYYYNPKEILFDKNGVLPTWEDINSEDDAEKYFVRKKNALSIYIVLDRCLVLETILPHSTFTIKEDGADYCVGLVIELS